MNVLQLRRTAVSILGLAAFFVILAAAGCASLGGAKHTGPSVRQMARNGWWYASFKINWPRDKAPWWDADLLIAHRIISPVLDRYGKEILLWRFHRRAVRDKDGHQFSFIFYTTPANARRIYAAINSSALLHRLQAKGVVLRVFMDDTKTIARPGIQATSDPTWSPALQRAWPYFIMGVSRTWLDLISQYAGDTCVKPLSTAEMLACYRRINQKMETTWKNEGGHAFLHHLNALFGYGPVDVNIRGKIEMQF